MHCLIKSHLIKSHSHFRYYHATRIREKQLCFALLIYFTDLWPLFLNYALRITRHEIFTDYSCRARVALLGTPAHSGCILHIVAMDAVAGKEGVGESVY